MSRRKITDPICFYTTHSMRLAIDNAAQEMDLTISELMREIVASYLGENTGAMIREKRGEQ